MKPMKFIFVFFLISLATQLWAYPQMITHGYTNCMTCHFSPSGGGMLTEYGRSLSREALSTAGTEGEVGVLMGAIKTPNWLHAGGDVRVLQSYLNTEMFEQAKFMLMQADVELGVESGKWLAVATGGYQNSMSSNYTGVPLMSRRHYVRYQASDSDVIRAGKFNVPVGINWPDHFIFSKKDLGWDEGSETYNVEYSHYTESTEWVTSGSVGRPEANDLRLDRSILGKFAFSFSEKNKVGIGTYLGNNDLGSRLLVTPTAIFTVLPHLSVYAEVDFQKMLGGNRGQNFGVIETLRANYEVIQGLHLYVMQEYGKLDLDKSLSAKEAYTLGVQWFFRPHVEVAGGLRKQRSLSMSDSFGDFAWAMMHYYL
jgi:hypothetical protein